MLARHLRDGAGRRLAAIDRPASIVPVRAIERGGAVTLRDGVIVRALELTPLSPLASGSDAAERALGEVAALLGGLAPGEALQWYVESRPVAAGELCPPLAACEAVGAELERTAAEDLARIERSSPDPPAVERAVYAIVQTPPGRGTRLARAGAARGPLAGAHRRALERSLAHADRVAAALAAAGLRPRLVDGLGMSRLLLRRLRDVPPAPAGEPSVEVAGALDARDEARRAIAAATRLLELLRGVTAESADERRVTVGRQLEQVVTVGALPGADVRDWLAPLLAGGQHYALSIYTRARADGMLDLGVYQSLRECGSRPDPLRLAAAVDATVRSALSLHGVRIDRGEFSQRRLWPATLPLGQALAEAMHRVEPAVAAAALPLLGEHCGSPGGVPFGRGAQGRVQRLDPWDPAHRHSAVLIAGGNARERAAALAALAARLAAAGAAVQALDGEGELAARCAGIAGATSFASVEASAGEPLLPLAGAAAAALSQTIERLPAAAAGERGRGVLAVAGADRLLGEPGGADWLRRTALHARRDDCCLLLAGAETAPFDAAGLLGVLPVRILLPHPPGAAARLGERFGLAPPEIRAIVRDDAPADDGAAALWLGGDRGRSLVRLLELAEPARSREAVA